MIKIVDNDIYRDGQKVGWLEGSHVYDKSGKKLGRVDGNDIYDHSGNKKAYVEGRHIELQNDSKRISIDDNRKHVTGGTHSDTTRAAVRILMGD